MPDAKIIKTFTSKKGNPVTFRYPAPEDFEAIWAYACDLAAEDTFVELAKAPTREEEQEWFTGVLKDIKEGNKTYMAVFVDNAYAGSGEIRRGKGRRKHTGEVGLSLGSAFRSEGIGTELLRTLVDEGRASGLRLLTLNCFETNDAALRVYEKVGFKKAGVIPGAIAHKDTFVGEVKMYLAL